MTKQTTRDERAEHDDRTQQWDMRNMNLTGLAMVCFGQLLVGAGAQAALLILGQHKPGLYAMAGLLMAFSAFGIMLRVTAGPRGPVTWRACVMPALAALIMVTASVLMYVFN